MIIPLDKNIDTSVRQISFMTSISTDAIKYDYKQWRQVGYAPEELRRESRKFSEVVFFRRHDNAIRWYLHSVGPVMIPHRMFFGQKGQE
jgi:hypothetical protein